MKPIRGRHARPALLLAVVAALAVQAGPAGAATVKPYVAVVTTGAAAPDFAPATAAVSEAPAGSLTTFYIKLYNYNDQQPLGSANITLPPGLRLGPGSTTPGGTTVELRNLALPRYTTGPAGAPPSVTVAAVVDVPCSAGGATGSWTVVAKQANNFNGLPGNALTAATSPPSALDTRVTGACRLQFGPEPNAARVGEVVTSTPFNTPAGATVAVKVLDGADQVVTTSSATITLTAVSSWSGTRTGVATATATAGVATFPTLKIAAPGAYALDASSPGLAGDTSSFVQIAQTATVCRPGAPCAASSTGTGRAPTSLTSTSDGLAGDSATSFLTQSFGAVPIRCTDAAGNLLTLTPPDADHTFVVDLNNPLRTKTLTVTVDKIWVNLNSNNGAAFLPLCYGSPKAFTTAFGTPSPTQGFFDYDGDGTPETQYVGLLPDCSALADPGSQACVLKRYKNSADGKIVARLPPLVDATGKVLDPKGMG